MQSGQIRGGTEYYAQTLAVRREVTLLGEWHPDTADTYNKIAWVLSSQGQYAEALKYFAKALAVRLEVLGVQHKETARSHHNNMANVSSLCRSRPAQ